MWKIAVACVALLAACKAEKREPSAAPPAPGSATATKFDLAALLAGTKGPALIGPFAKARFGMTAAELAAAVPEPIVQYNGRRRDAETIYHAGFDSFEDDRTFDILLVYIPEAQMGEVEKAWGKPVRLKAYDETYDVWLDRDARLRARLTRSLKDEPRLEISRYQPLAETLGPAGPRFALETKRPFLGSTREELRADYPEHARFAAQQLNLDLPNDEYGSSNLFTILLVAPDDVTTTNLLYSVTHGDDPAVKQERMAMLVAKYGAVTERTEPDGTKLTVLGKHTPEVVMFDRDGVFLIESPRVQRAPK